jgi:hypothetical protein
MTKNEIILVFSPGRCGTAYLAQVFGQEKWFKGMLAEPTENTLVLHEKISVDYRSLYVMKEKEFRHKDNLNIQRVYIQKILKLSETANKFFVTSNSIGRHCGYFLVDVHKKYKYIYIERDIDALITSWIKRFRNFRETYGQKNLDLHLKKMWESTKYTPLDNNSLLKIGKNEWYKMPLDNKLRWYCEELKKRWKNLKKDIPSDKYIETSYEKIITTEGLDELSEFIELPYSKELMKHRINKSQKY